MKTPEITIPRTYVLTVWRVKVMMTPAKNHQHTFRAHVVWQKSLAEECRIINWRSWVLVQTSCYGQRAVALIMPKGITQKSLHCEIKVLSHQVSSTRSNNTNLIHTNTYIYNQPITHNLVQFIYVKLESNEIFEITLC